jgi:hypothetical protein
MIYQSQKIATLIIAIGYIHKWWSHATYNQWLLYSMLIGQTNILNSFGYIWMPSLFGYAKILFKHYLANSQDFLNIF